MKIRLIYAALACTVSLFLTNCSKPDNNPATPLEPPPVITPGPPSTSSANVWECEINGVQYSGLIDTCFWDPINPLFPDTIVSCTGTSLDKKSNIYFRVRINRKITGSSIVSTNGEAYFVFDTTSTSLYKASSNTGMEIVYQIDSFKNGRLHASFSGSIKDYNVYGGEISQVRNGKFSCELGKGSKEPKFFSFRNNNEVTHGYIKSGYILTNTLILDCIPVYSGDGQKFKLMIRTGGTIKPGVYKSADGDAGLQYFVPSIYDLYINDELGDLDVTILTVRENIITGSFAGTNSDGKKITMGTFICRVKDYRPQTDLPTKWKFNFDDRAIYMYTIYGGNVTTMSRSKVDNRFLVTVNGESDNGDTHFKIVLSSSSVITKGVYKTAYSPMRLDTLEFKSNQKLWNGNNTNLSATYNENTFCRIDSIDTHNAWGSLYGNIQIRFSGNTSTTTEIKKGSFMGAF